MTREPEWDDRSRSEALAGLLDKRAMCQTCGTDDAMVREVKADMNVRWTDGRLFNVKAYRCLACMALESVSRDAEPEGHKPVRGVYSPRDGLRHVVSEIKKG